MHVNGTPYRTVWLESRVVRMIDQTLLPHRFEVMTCPDHHATCHAIKAMNVRGAGAIGAAAGFAMAQAALEASGDHFDTYISEAAERVRQTRPTAQNLFYAIDRVLAVIGRHDDITAKRNAAVHEAQAIADDDVNACEAIGEHGAALIRDGMRIGTHCNAGWLAFVDWGSALAPVYAAQRVGKNVFVYADETRPRGQGASLTAWELQNEHVPHAIIADNAAGHFMARGEIDLFIVGADRIARNGDVANKIGTYEKAVLAKEHSIPFYVAAPTSTVDRACASGNDIPIEERSQDEVLYAVGRRDDGSLDRVRLAPETAIARNPAFDVTPARFVVGIITENGIVPASEQGIASLFR